MPLAIQGFLLDLIHSCPIMQESQIVVDNAKIPADELLVRDSTHSIKTGSVISAMSTRYGKNQEKEQAQQDGHLEGMINAL